MTDYLSEISTLKPMNENFEGKVKKPRVLFICILADFRVLRDDIDAWLTEIFPDCPDNR